MVVFNLTISLVWHGFTRQHSILFVVEQINRFTIFKLAARMTYN